MTEEPIQHNPTPPYLLCVYTTQTNKNSWYSTLEEYLDKGLSFNINNFTGDWPAWVLAWAVLVRLSRA